MSCNNYFYSFCIRIAVNHFLHENAVIKLAPIPAIIYNCLDPGLFKKGYRYLNRTICKMSILDLSTRTGTGNFDSREKRFQI